MTLSADAFLTDGKKYLHSAAEGKEVFTVSDGSKAAVIMSAEEYYRHREILETLSELNEADEEFARGDVFTIDEVFGELDEKIARLQAQRQ
jgi:PHD/YefM family antitoxin component YafN of YafNO toxin-antitoxin module